MTLPLLVREAPYIIAEIGVNHDGDVARAIELVDAAATADADAVKLQLFETDRLMSRAARLAAYQASAGEQDPFDMLRRLELSIDDMAPIVARAQALGLHAIVTVFSVELTAVAARLPWDACKSASPDIIHKPLLESMAATGKPLIVSTGAATLPEALRAADWLSSIRGRLALLQCVSSYPTPIEHAALGGIEALARATNLPVGYSDHTTEIDTGARAVAAGAMLLEKHLTYNRHAQGPDHAASLEPAMFAEYVARARQAARTPALVGAAHQPCGTAASASVGPIEKNVLKIERDVRTVSRQSVVATRHIARGETIDAEALTFKRPGIGIPPWRVDSVAGRVAARDIEADMPLVEDDLA